MTVIDGMLSGARHTWHALDGYSSVPDFDTICIDQDIHLVTD
jgi:hypothetical protein